jgi:putative transposase
MQTHYEVSESRACAVAMCSRSLYRYESRRDPRTELRARIREIAQVRVRYGYRRVHVLVVRAGRRTISLFIGYIGKKAWACAGSVRSAMFLP